VSSATKVSSRVSRSTGVLKSLFMHDLVSMVVCVNRGGHARASNSLRGASARRCGRQILGFWSSIPAESRLVGLPFRLAANRSCRAAPKLSHNVASSADGRVIGESTRTKVRTAYAALLPEMRRWREAGLSYRQIAGCLDGAGSTARTRAPWNHNQVKVVLSRVESYSAGQGGSHRLAHRIRSATRQH
jgi:hypothetical protein